MKIFVYDEFHPEDNAMLQALYSRSGESVKKHVDKVRASGSGNFMEKFYVGYGHLSIADCGSTTIFIEGVSMLVAKAIQDWPLYSGQETSTRYIDFSKQKIEDPIGSRESKAILDQWLKFYANNREGLIKFLKKKYPIKEGENEGVYERAIAARSFDILRGFLPAGATTQLAWHTNLRQAHDHLMLLRHHPLKEVRDVAKKIHTELKKHYAHSFSHKLYPDQENYHKWLMGKYAYFNPKSFTKELTYKTTIKNAELDKYKDVLKKRPIKTTPPYFLGQLGQITFDFLLDFGSFRDIQRHRSAIQYMPLLTTRFGFGKWYLDQLPDDMRTKGEKLIKSQMARIKKLKVSEEERQYYIAMGFQVPCRFVWSLPAAVYTMELRTSKTVHPSLRQLALQMSKALTKMFPSLVLHVDNDPDDWDVRRGLQNIQAKK
jgi:thymidylate synthase ThyX